MPFKKILFLFLLFISIDASSQNYTVSNQRAIKKYKEASLLYDTGGKKDEIIKLIDEAIKTCPRFIEAWLMKGDLYRETGQSEEEILALEQSLSIDSLFFINTYYNLGKVCYKTGRYEKAANYLTLFGQHTNASHPLWTQYQNLQRHNTVALQIKKHPIPFNPVNLGPEINSADNEYFPKMTADEEILIFTVLVGQDLQKHQPGQEDFYYSKKKNNNWEKRQPLGSPPNTPGNEGAPSISPDGKTIYFAACDRSDSRGRCDIYYSSYQNGKWGEAVNLGPPVNTPAWESQPAISADGKTLYFVSNRDGGKGGMDIWQSQLIGYDPKGIPRFGNPVNMGDSINTPGNEIAPFIHPDGKTLYFSSDYWPGMGGLDLFISKLKDDHTWSTPLNAGFPINTCKDESGLYITPSGDKAYYASNRNGYGQLDLYSFDLPPAFRPNPVSYVKGLVCDHQTGKPLLATIEIVNLNNQESNQLKTEEDGKFLTTLPVHSTYACWTTSPGYLFNSKNIDISSVNKATHPFEFTITLDRIRPGEKVILNNLFFATDSFLISKNSDAELNKAANFIKTNSNIIIEIKGHTDNSGSAKHNLDLSEKRARAVWHYLIRSGVNEQQLRYKGYGDSLPIADNNTEEGKAKNRRTEMEIVSSK